jgi:hypothetical protein
MKKIRVLSLVACLMAASLLCNSCYGPFRLTVKLHSWNGTVGDKWANTLVFFAFSIIPVYAVTVFLDALIFNSIEFWGGTNPVAMNEGESETKIVNSGNKVYSITAMKNRFLIEQLEGPHTGNIAEILFQPEDRSCYLIYQGEKTKLAEYGNSSSGEDRVKLFLPDGGVITMNASERNPELLRELLSSSINFLAVSE